MKELVIASLVSLIIFPAIAKTPPVVLPENAALLTMVPEDYPTDKESFRDYYSCYDILIDPHTQDLHPEPYFCPDFPRLSPVYVHHYRKLPEAPILARDKEKA